MMKLAREALDLGIFVSDINVSLKFYQETLGLEKVGETGLPVGMMHRLSYGNSFFKLIDPNEVPPKGPTGLVDQLGFRYVTFPVRNISEICEALKEKGVTFTVPETELRPGVRIAMVEDPDGNTVEFVQLDE
jgi:glyoxylase I family protein